MTEDSASNSVTSRKKESPTGWWIAGLLERHTQNGSLIYWNNLRLVRAVHWRDAFRRAVGFGLSDAASGRRALSGGWEFMGVTSLDPVEDEFEDGAELLFYEYDEKSEVPGIFAEDELQAIFEEGANL